MIIRISDIRLELGEDQEMLRQKAASSLKLLSSQLEITRLVRKSIDARRNRIQFCYSLEVEVEERLLEMEKLESLPNIRLRTAAAPPMLLPRTGLKGLKPVIVGSGPAGLFCALKLLQYGVKPLIIEQGEPMEKRIMSVERFWSGGALNCRSNVQYGEGGAGTFSDGKLTTRLDDPRVDEVLQGFVKFGAPEEILYLKKPHIGTDIIRQAVVAMRHFIESQGGEVRFNTRLTDLTVKDGRVQNLVVNDRDELDCDLAILAAGNSARELYRLLELRGISLVSKPFAVGVRIEHPQSSIDRMQYGKFAGHPELGPADYQFTYKDQRIGRSLYSFCMCPGGYVIAASSGPGQVVTNGMSYASRDNRLGNSALVVAVTPADWQNRVMGGLEFQESLESRAYEMGGGNYCAPAQRLDDFLEQKTPANQLHGHGTYRPGLNAASLWTLFPEDIAKTLQNGILYWGRKAPEMLHRDAVLTGVETRTSAPLRIVRDEQRRCEGIENLYPCGEGSGYSGGIVSSAVDGIKTAEQIIGG